MTIPITAETEQLVQAEIQGGDFQSVDHLTVARVAAWREKQQAKTAGAAQRFQAVEQALDFARNQAIPMGEVSIKALIHEGHRL